MSTIYSVSQITTYLKGLISRDALLKSVTIQGELSNVTNHGSGHIYFTIKDKDAALSAVMFKSDAYNLDFRPEEGMEVIVSGRFDVYEKTGRYQLYAKTMKRTGAGELYVKFLALRDELAERGMFADEYKQEIPRYISRLGVVTAPTGAAVRDIINITKRRNPYIQIILYPALVQGKGAAESIAKGIEVLNDADVDVIIAGRGGGSIEDLWAFNEESVAEAIFASRVPVISAVGHQTDTTIADYVADLRAPTPSAAAELAVYEYSELCAKLSEARGALLQQMDRVVKRDLLKIREYQNVFRNKRPDAVIASKRMRLADIENELRRHMRDGLDVAKRRLDNDKRGLSEGMDHILTRRKHEAALYAQRLKGVSPLEKLTMGYSYVTDASGRNVRDVDRLKTGDIVNIYMLNGKVMADVRGTEKTEY